MTNTPSDEQPVLSEKKMVLRGLTIDDFDELVALGERCFPGMKPWQREQIESQLKVFPQGQVVLVYDGRIVATSSSLIVEFSEYSDWANWREISDAGFIRNHDPEGDTLYGIEIMVDPALRGMKLSRRLYDARKKLAREMNLARIIIGGRIAGFHKVADTMDAHEYVERVMAKELTDPVMTPQLSNGFTLKRLIPDYLPSDTESRGYATFLEWANVDYRPDPTRHPRDSSVLRLCVVQYEMRAVKDFAEFATNCEYFVDAASDDRADFVVFPELFTLQLLSTLERMRPGLAARKLAELSPRIIELFTGLALRHNINIIGGSMFTLAEGGKLHNSAFLYRRDGTRGQQNKINITPNERKWWGVSPGDTIEVFNTDRGHLSIFLCHDIEFPELGRIAAAKGAELFFVPFNTAERRGFLRVSLCAQARSIENHVFTIISGCVGNLPNVQNADLHYAESAVYTPADFGFSRDAVAASSPPNVETLIVEDIDLDLLRRYRRESAAQRWRDRSRGLFRLTWTDAEGEHEA
ncbi:MAG: GNAT family N-acetyltransferase [Myxococcus sp.]|nr:GNAT family N-acetyltransferase [Myxococcus sp.]